MLGDIPQTWDEVWALVPGVYSWVQAMPLEWQPDGTPSGALRVELSVHNATSSTSGGSKTAMLAYIDGAATRTRYIGERSSIGDHWTKLATATPPQEFNLPLAEGWSGWIRYSKDQFGKVSAYGLVAKSTALISGDFIGTFPEGFRPSNARPMPIASNSANDGKSFATSGYVHSDGRLTLSGGSIATGYNLNSNLALNFEFVTVN